MELSSLNGNIIGVINYDIKESYNGLVKDIVLKKPEAPVNAEFEYIGVKTEKKRSDFGL